MTSTRDQIIEVTSALLESQGYHATGLSQILKESGTPKGSLYYYFPDGKEGLAQAAIERTGRLFAARIRENLAGHTNIAEAVRLFVHRIAHGVEQSGFRAGGPLQTVALETATTSERLNLVCREAYGWLQAAFTQALTDGGFDSQRAEALAVFITAAIEGGIVLSRTQHSGDPLRRVAEELAELLRLGQARL